MTPEQIIQEAMQRYKPVAVLLLFSGGHDSLCSTHYSAQYLKSTGIDFTVYHANTGIGIKETKEFVREVCRRYGWRLYEGYPKQKESYENFIREYGFPGPAAHTFMYTRLKAHPLQYYVSNHCKSSPCKHENVLLLTGVRKSESRRRMGYRNYMLKEKSRIWCSPLFYWNEQDIEYYMKKNNLPRNPVKDRICISGECLCGAFASKEEWAEIQYAYPDAAAEINRLHEIAKANGHNWGWGTGPKRAAKGKPGYMPMCVSCEEKNFNNNRDETESHQRAKGGNPIPAQRGNKSQQPVYLQPYSDAGGICGIGTGDHRTGYTHGINTGGDHPADGDGKRYAMNSPAYYRARLQAIEDLFRLQPVDRGAMVNTNRVLLRNAFVPDDLKDELEQRITQQLHENRQQYPNTALSFTELTSFNTWFALHPEKVAGMEYTTTSLHFPIQLKGSQQDITQTIRAGMDSAQTAATKAKQLLEKLRRL